MIYLESQNFKRIPFINQTILNPKAFLTAHLRAQHRQGSTLIDTVAVHQSRDVS